MRRLVRYALIVVTGLILPMVTVSVATAATAPPLALHTTATAIGTHSRGNGPNQSVITCTAKQNNPHHSTHKPETVNATGSVTCTAPVASITMTMYLYWDGYLQNSKTFRSVGKSSVSGNVAAPCETGGWQASLIAEIYFPPGYEPSPQSVSDSKTADVTSC
jgi:hypothetical protein